MKLLTFGDVKAHTGNELETERVVGLIRIFVKEAFNLKKSQAASFKVLEKSTVDGKKTGEKTLSMAGMRWLNTFWSPVNEVPHWNSDTRCVEINVAPVDFENISLGTIEHITLVSKQFGKTTFSLDDSEMENLSKALKDDDTSAILIPNLYTSLPILAMFCKMGVTDLAGDREHPFVRRLVVGPSVNNRRIDRYNRIYNKGTPGGEKPGLIQTFQDANEDPLDLNRLSVVGAPYFSYSPQPVAVKDYSKIEAVFAIPEVPEDIATSEPYAGGIDEKKMDEVWVSLIGQHFKEFFLKKQRPIVSEELFEKFGPKVRAVLSFYTLVKTLSGAFNGLKSDSDCYRFYGFLMHRMNEAYIKTKPKPKSKPTDPPTDPPTDSLSPPPDPDPMFPDMVLVPGHNARQVACYRSRILLHSQVLSHSLSLAFLEGNGRIVATIYAMSGIMPPRDLATGLHPEPLRDIKSNILSSSINMEVMQHVNKKPLSCHVSGWLRSYSSSVQQSGETMDRRNIVDCLQDFIREAKENVEFMTPPDLVRANSKAVKDKESNAKLMVAWIEKRQKAVATHLAAEKSEVVKILLNKQYQGGEGKTDTQVVERMCNQAAVRVQTNRHILSLQLPFDGIHMIMVLLILSLCDLCPNEDDRSRKPKYDKIMIDFLSANGRKNSEEDDYFSNSMFARDTAASCGRFAQVDEIVST
jgi:hypothetical protein